MQKEVCELNDADTGERRVTLVRVRWTSGTAGELDWPCRRLLELLNVRKQFQLVFSVVRRILVETSIGPDNLDDVVIPFVAVSSVMNG